jgi:hypothetical protein
MLQFKDAGFLKRFAAREEEGVVRTVSSLGEHD